MEYWQEAGQGWMSHASSLLVIRSRKRLLHRMLLKLQLLFAKATRRQGRNFPDTWAGSCRIGRILSQDLLYFFVQICTPGALFPANHTILNLLHSFPSSPEHGARHGATDRLPVAWQRNAAGSEILRIDIFPRCVQITDCCGTRL